MYAYIDRRGRTKQEPNFDYPIISNTSRDLQSSLKVQRPAQMRGKKLRSEIFAAAVVPTRPHVKDHPRHQASDRVHRFECFSCGYRSAVSSRLAALAHYPAPGDDSSKRLPQNSVKGGIKRELLLVSRKAQMSCTTFVSIFFLSFCPLDVVLVSYFLRS